MCREPLLCSNGCKKWTAIFRDTNCETWVFYQIEISLTKGKTLKVEERVNKLELSDNEVDTVVE